MYYNNKLTISIFISDQNSSLTVLTMDPMLTFHVKDINMHERNSTFPWNRLCNIAQEFFEERTITWYFVK